MHAIDRQWNHRLLLILLFVAALLAGLAGIRELPADAHEALVIQTAREMHNRGDWIVPWFNDEPRLKKPPLNYWLTALVGTLDIGTTIYKPWHGRVVSLLAGLGIIFCTLVTGRRFFNRRTALFAAAILLTTNGWFTYTHDARPDMLYAFLCTLVMTCFAAALNSHNIRKVVPMALAGWLAMALATLSKGPHMPLMYLAGSVVFAFLTGHNSRSIVRRLHPVGPILFIVVALPWWLLLNYSLGPEMIENTQLSGSLLTVSAGNLFELYYLYRPLILLVPWILLLPFTLIWIKHKGMTPGVKFTLVMILLPAMLLELGPQKRWYYLLPSIMPMCLLLGAGMDKLLDIIGNNRMRAFSALACALLVSLLTLQFQIRPAIDSAAKEVMLNMTILLMVIGTFLAVTTFQLSRQSIFPVIFSLFFVTYVFIGITESGWSRDRFERKELADTVLAMAEPDTRFFSMALDPAVYTYYIGKHIESNATLADIESARTGNSIIVFSSPSVLDTLPGDHDLIGKVVTSDKVTDIAIYIPGINNTGANNNEKPL